MRNSHTGDSSICVLIVPAFLSFYEVSEHFVFFATIYWCAGDQGFMYKEQELDKSQKEEQHTLLNL